MTPSIQEIAALVTRAREAMQDDRAAFAVRIGSSLRTVARWQAGETTPAPFQLADIAKVIHPVDRALAAELAAAAGQTLVGLGLESPPKPAPPPPPVYAVTPRHLARLVLCDAAEALDMSPRAMRPALAAALETMCELGVSAAVAREGLAGAHVPAKAKGTTPAAARTERDRPPRAAAKRVTDE